MADPSLRITFRDMDPSPAMEARIRERMEKLERFSDRITACEVTVAAPHKHSRNGELYRVGIALHMPDRVLVANRTGAKGHAHENVYVALREAFDAATRQVEDQVRVKQGR